MPKDEIIYRLSRIDPMTDDDMGNVYCFFCHEEEHTEDCIWLAARKIMGVTGEE